MMSFRVISLEGQLINHSSQSLPASAARRQRDLWTLQGLPTLRLRLECLLLLHQFSMDLNQDLQANGDTYDAFSETKIKGYVLEITSIHPHPRAPSRR
jgi:hypothetical protein